jgi:DNA repair exonuclease SbcCD ATPase subunit
VTFWNAILTAVGGSATTLLVIGFFGRTLVAHWFGKDLESYKQGLAHEGAQQIESLRARNAEQLQEARHKLDTLLKQTSKLHEKEFSVLEESWGPLNEVLGHLALITSRYQEYPALDRMSEGRFDRFVEKSPFDEADREELRAAPDRNKFYQERIFWYRLRDAQTASKDFHRKIHGSSIFIEPSIRELLVKIDNLMWNAIVSRRISHEAGDVKLWSEAANRLSNDIEPLKAQIEILVQKRLGYQL